ncbi:MAG: glycosyltransferase [Betaproteobacteria bacterium]
MSGDRQTAWAGMTPLGALDTSQIDDASPIVCSVLVGRVSTRDGERIFELLSAMRRQRPAVRHEIIVADRLNNEVSARIAADFPEVMLIPCASETTLPALRAAALASARGVYAIVTEDHCVPADDWLAEIVAGFRRATADVAAVGGSVANGLRDRWIDRATFQCEYGKYVPPVDDSLSDDLPGMNIGYSLEHLRTVDSALLHAGFWESDVHTALLQRGFVFQSSNRIRVTHKKHFGFTEFIRQRFWYSRHFAGNRFPENSPARRAVAFALTPALPLILLWRFHTAAVRRPAYIVEFGSSLPLLTVFALVWAIGEMAGYVFGPGDALRKLE